MSYFFPETWVFIYFPPKRVKYWQIYSKHIVSVIKLLLFPDYSCFSDFNNNKDGRIYISFFIKFSRGLNGSYQVPPSSLLLSVIICFFETKSLIITLKIKLGKTMFAFFLVAHSNRSTNIFTFGHLKILSCRRAQTM